MKRRQRSLRMRAECGRSCRPRRKRRGWTRMTSWRKSECFTIRRAESGKSKMIVVSEDSRDDAEVLVCFRVDMKHRFRRNLMKGEAESAMTKQKLQQRMREQ